MAARTTAGVGGAPGRVSPVEHVWRAPLVPLALVITAGVVADRYLTVPLLASLSLTVAGLLAWWCTHKARQPGLALVYLGLAAAGLGAGYHHWHLHGYSEDDISHFTRPEPRLVRIHGVFDEEPTVLKSQPRGPLSSFLHSDSTMVVLRATALLLESDWQPISGRIRLIFPGVISEVHVSDEVELVGWLENPQGPWNPGEIDRAAQLRDQRIRAVLRVRSTADVLIHHTERWRGTPSGWLMAVRGWCQRQVKEAIHEKAGLALALLLGDSSEMTQADWEEYKRTGVVAALVISGQHLVILASVFWWLLRAVGVPSRHGALFIALLVLGYTFLVGGGPPIVRATVIVCVACGALLFRRSAPRANSFALAWLVVLIINPTDLCTSGCQLSFLATAILYGCSRFVQRAKDPSEQLLEDSRPLWQQWLRYLGRLIAVSYFINLMIWLAITPLLAAHYHMISPVALLLGPPVTLLTSLALGFGFQIFPGAAVGKPLCLLLGRLTSWSLGGCDWLVETADQEPLFCWYVGDIPTWWLCGYYVALLGLLTLRPLQLRWRWLVLVGSAWLCVGLIGGSARPHTEELRCTFLSVGHGGCTVLETPDGRTLLYDAGAMSGPEITRRHIAPFLWHRGIRRIDELFLSHADLDHFNGVPELLERFAVGHVTWTPSFQHRNTPGVRAILETLEQRRIPARAVCSGDQLRAGETTLNVLHPPLHGPEGNENARSLVLLVQHASHRILLTGDLEGPGLQRVLSLPPEPVDVLMAPHHGSRAANTSELAAWAQPRVVVSSQGVRHNLKSLAAPYTLQGARFFDTALHGAVTIHSGRSGMILETFRSRQRIQVLPDALR